MVFTDAPYNVPVDGHVCGLGKVQHMEFAKASGEMNSKQFIAFLASAFQPMVDTLRDGALLYLCMDWRHMREMLEAIDDCGLTLINLCVWNKSNGGMGSLYRSKHELIFVAKNDKAPHINNVELGRHGRYRTNVWDYPGVNSFGANRNEDLADHPTVKPTTLVADAIRDVTKHGDIVLDAFLGSGTTILAAERTRRVAYGIEIEPAFVDVAIRRWETLSGRKATLAETGESFADVAARRSQEAEAALVRALARKSEHLPLQSNSTRNPMPFRRNNTSNFERQDREPNPSGSPRSTDEPRAQSSANQSEHTAKVDQQDYKVGYGKPPKATQFKKGKSGNPNGRPKGAKGLNSIVKTHLLERVAVRTGKGTRRITRIEALVLKLLEAAGGGDHRALVQLMSMYSAAVPDAAPESVTSQDSKLTETDEASRQHHAARSSMRD